MSQDRTDIYRLNGMGIPKSVDWIHRELRRVERACGSAQIPVLAIKSGQPVVILDESDFLELIRGLADAQPHPEPTRFVPSSDQGRGAA